MRSGRAALALAAAAALTAACAGPSRTEKKSVSALVAAGDYAGAAAAIRADSGEYGASNRVLYDLDLGMALQLAGRYNQSEASFEDAQARMEAFYTRSVSRMSGALAANENVEEYRGRPEDRALCHLFHGLDYVLQGRADEALVEIRQLEAFLDERAGSATGRDDAFAHELSALLYEDSGLTDDARISHEAAVRAYARDAEAGGLTAPDFPFPSRLGGDGEVAALLELGPAPRLVSVPGSFSGATASTDAPKGLAGILLAPLNAAEKTAGAVGDAVLNTSHPEYARDDFRARRAEVSADAAAVRAEPVEDVLAAARADLAGRLEALKARSVGRAVLKLAGTATGLDATGSEFSDVRSWQTLPSLLLLARLRLPPGEHRLTLRYLDADGREVLTRERTVVVRPGRRTWLLDKTVE